MKVFPDFSPKTDVFRAQRGYFPVEVNSDHKTAVGDDEQRIAEPASAHVLEEGAHRLRVFLRPP
jgi:hypothetical protein